MRLENRVASKDNQKNSPFANCVVFLTGRKGFSQPTSIAGETLHNSAENIWPEPGAKHGFGAVENDWLGAEAYIDSLR